MHVNIFALTVSIINGIYSYICGQYLYYEYEYECHKLCARMHRYSGPFIHESHQHRMNRNRPEVIVLVGVFARLHSR